MEFNFSFVAQEIYYAWAKTSQQRTVYKTRYNKNKVNIICAIYRTVLYSDLNIPAGSYREQHEISVRPQDASHIMSGKKPPSKKIIAIHNSFNVEMNMVKHIKEEITPHLDTNKIGTLTENLLNGVDSSKIPSHIKKDIHNHTKQEDLAYLLMRVIRGALDVYTQNTVQPSQPGVRAQTVEIDLNPIEDRYNIQARLDKMEQQISKITAVIEEKSEQINRLEILLATAQNSDDLANRMKYLEQHISEVTICLQELQGEYDRLRWTDTYAAGTISKNSVLCSPSYDVLLNSAEADISELENRIENAIYEDGEIWSALYDADLPQTEKTAEFLLDLIESWDCYEIYDILFNRYAHLLSPAQHKKLVDKAKSQFVPEVYKKWDMRSVYLLSTILTENGSLKKDTTES